MKELNQNKKILYEIHGYDPSEGTKNVHHIIFKSEGGRNTYDNLSLLDIDTHNFVHQLIDKIDKSAGIKSHRSCERHRKHRRHK